MRTIDKLERAAHWHEDHGDESVTVTLEELRHLLAIAKAAYVDVTGMSLPERKWDGYIEIVKAVEDARKAGLFGNAEEGRNT